MCSLYIWFRNKRLSAYTHTHTHTHTYIYIYIYIYIYMCVCVCVCVCVADKGINDWIRHRSTNDKFYFVKLSDKLGDKQNLWYYWWLFHGLARYGWPWVLVRGCGLVMGCLPLHILRSTQGHVGAPLQFWVTLRPAVLCTERFWSDVPHHWTYLWPQGGVLPGFKPLRRG